MFVFLSVLRDIKSSPLGLASTFNLGCKLCSFSRSSKVINTVRLGSEYDVQMDLSDFDSDDQLSVIVDLR